MEEEKEIRRHIPVSYTHLADEEDFSPSHLEESSITRQYENVVLEDCLREIVQEIEGICHREQDIGQPEFQNI